MEVIEIELPGVLILEPEVFGDERGFFIVTWNQRRYEEISLPACFVQDNLSFSARGVLRRLHFQNPNPQGKLISVLHGEVFDVAVDVRVGSPTFGEWVGVYLSADNKRQLYVPEGFGPGFAVTSDAALSFFKCTDCYSPRAEGSVLWNDPHIGIEWPVDDPVLSAKDRVALPLREIPTDLLPRYKKD